MRVGGFFANDWNLGVVGCWRGLDKQTGYGNVRLQSQISRTGAQTKTVKYVAKFSYFMGENRHADSHELLHRVESQLVQVAR